MFLEDSITIFDNGPGEEFDSGDLQDLREDDQDGFLMVAAAKYHFLVNTGTPPQSALLRLVWQLAEEGINLPRVLNEYPELTEEYFGDFPGFPEGFVSDIDRLHQESD